MFPHHRNFNLKQTFIFRNAEWKSWKKVLLLKPIKSYCTCKLLYKETVVFGVGILIHSINSDLNIGTVGQSAVHRKIKLIFESEKVEKWFIMFRPELADLNLRTELFGWCLHKTRNLLIYEPTWQLNLSSNFYNFLLVIWYVSERSTIIL